MIHEEMFELSEKNNDQLLIDEISHVTFHELKRWLAEFNISLVSFNNGDRPIKYEISKPTFPLPEFYDPRRRHDMAKIIYTHSLKPLVHQFIERLKNRFGNVTAIYISCFQLNYYEVGPGLEMGFTIEFLYFK